MKKHFALVPALALGALIVSAPAQAAFTLSNSAGVTTSTPGASTVITFDSPVGVGVASATFAGSAGLNSGTNPGGGGNWGTVFGGTFEVVLTGLADYLGFLWGTRDSYNSVSFFNGQTSVGTFTPAGFTGVGDFANFTAGTTADQFNRVVFLSGGCCFEFDNIAVRLVPTDPSVVPLPAPMALLASGLLLLGGLARRCG